jgi:hypothetical protein
MGIVDRALAAFLTFMGILFALIVAWALSENFAHLHITLFGSRMAVVWTMLSAATAGAVLRWRQLAERAPPARHTPARAATPAPEGRRRRVISADNIRDDMALARSKVLARAKPSVDSDADESDPNEIDMANAVGVAKVQSHRDPALWHEATMAALAYRGDQHGFLRWVLQQPEADRATAGWIFLWAEGSRYLRGETSFPLNYLASDEVLDLFRAVCERSQVMGFASDALGLDPDFEAERLKCLAVIENGELAPGIIAPTALLARPFDSPRHDDRFTLDDGIIICEEPL